MEWNSTINEIFQRLMEKVPAQFREMSIESHIQKSEELATERGSTIVEEPDLVQAMLFLAPEFVKDNIINGLRKEGLDVDKYIKA